MPIDINIILKMEFVSMPNSLNRCSMFLVLKLLINAKLPPFTSNKILSKAHDDGMRSRNLVPHGWEEHRLCILESFL